MPRQVRVGACKFQAVQNSAFHKNWKFKFDKLTVQSFCDWVNYIDNYHAVFYFPLR